MKIRLLFTGIVLALLTACNDDDNKVPEIRPTAKGEYTDERDGTTYGWVRIGDLEWMTSNLKYNEEGPYYERVLVGQYGEESKLVNTFSVDTDLEADYEENGNLYYWEEACETCPEGWRLPTDKDWQNLERALGMSAAEADAEGWRGEHVATLLRQDAQGTGMALPLAGNVSYWKFNLLYLNYVGEFGYYWTASEIENSGLQTPTVWYRKIFENYTTVYRGSSPLDKMMRVRCCRDAGK